MKRTQRAWIYPALALAAVLTIAGCTRERRGDNTVVVKPAAIASGARAVVESYLNAAAKADGAGMYALIATSERKDETPQSLTDTARDRYSAGMSWEILKVEDKNSTADVVVDFKQAKVDPNPYRFTLTREGGEWRIVQSPELHETADDGIEIKL